MTKIRIKYTADDTETFIKDDKEYKTKPQIHNYSIDTSIRAANSNQSSLLITNLMFFLHNVLQADNAMYGVYN